MLVWVLWQNRNNKVWNDTNEPGRVLGVKARHLWEDWIAVQHVQQQYHSADQQHQTMRWEKPEQGWLKCNTDAAFHSNLNKLVSVGACMIIWVVLLWQRLIGWRGVVPLWKVNPQPYSKLCKSWNKEAILMLSLRWIPKV
jgi:hypothetical protein